MTPAEIETTFKRLRKQQPEPRTELNYQSPFELLIAVILSAQATDVSVNLATDRLYLKANSPGAILRLGVNGLKKYIRTIGLYNTKAENVIKTCQLLVDLHGGEVPDNRRDLEALPGVGRKTANVILNTAFGQPTIAVDTHIFRVSNRTGIAPGKNVVEVESRLLEVIPERFKRHAHHWLILLGRYTCVARKPRCEICLINDICPSAFAVPDTISFPVGKKKTIRKKVIRKSRKAVARTSKQSSGKPVRSRSTKPES